MAHAGAVMVDLVMPLLVLGVLAGVVAALAVLAARARRRGIAGQAIAAAMAAYDEGFHGTGHDSFVEMTAAERRSEQAPAPGPGGGLGA